jgi:glycosyltransferase involved in cell wall biosynthesis
MADALKKIAALDGNACRAVAQEHFSLERMVDGYLDLYQKVIRLSGLTRARLELTS